MTADSAEPPIHPMAPRALVSRIRELAPVETVAGAPGADALVDAVEQALGRLLAQGSLTRDSALDLLAIDALVTYAFEVAAAEPESIERRATDAMRRIAQLVAVGDA